MANKHKDEKFEEESGESKDDFTVKKVMKESYGSEGYSDSAGKAKPQQAHEPLDKSLMEADEEAPPERGEEYRKDGIRHAEKEDPGEKEEYTQ